MRATGGIAALGVVLAVGVLSACQPSQAVSAARTTTGQTAKATFAGGCFWCMEHPLDQLDGVIDVVSGYSGGSELNPTCQHDVAVQSMLSLLEPMLVVVLGGIVGTIVLALFLPLVKMIESVSSGQI